MGSPWEPLWDIALTITPLQFEEVIGPTDVGLEQLPNPVLVLSALPNADSTDVEPSTCLQAGMHGRMASICIPVVTDAPIALYVEKWADIINYFNWKSRVYMSFNFSVCTVTAKVSQTPEIQNQPRIFQVKTKSKLAGNIL